ncbi:MAG: hypothetical protein JO287_27220 [Pseudonocardiales bacterium]|nr:hypothetical protein [Pseudonocardiales bacterium]
MTKRQTVQWNLTGGRTTTAGRRLVVGFRSPASHRVLGSRLLEPGPRAGDAAESRDQRDTIADGVDMIVGTSHSGRWTISS